MEPVEPPPQATSTASAPAAAKVVFMRALPVAGRDVIRTRS